MMDTIPSSGQPSPNAAYTGLDERQLATLTSVRRAFLIAGLLCYTNTIWFYGIVPIAAFILMGRDRYHRIGYGLAFSYIVIEGYILWNTLVIGHEGGATPDNIVAVSLQGIALFVVLVLLGSVRGRFLPNGQMPSWSRLLRIGTVVLVAALLVISQIYLFDTSAIS